jgi:sugar phosphate permease
LPAFFQKVYPLYKTQYSLYTALIISICGFSSNLIGGLISDKYEKKSRMTKAIVSIVGSALAIPAVGLCTLTTNSFHTSLFFMAVSYLVSECWMSPAVTMMQNTVKPE